MRVIIDVMGGDNAPDAQIEGAVLARKEYGTDITLVGDADIIGRRLASLSEDIKDYIVVNAPEKIGTDEDPFLVVKGKKNCSMAVALGLLRDGEGDALVSSGNTGALLTGSQLITKRIKGVRRAALAPVIPTKTGGALLIDCGANAECTSDYLLQFALMGSRYCTYTMKKNNPRVALLNNGAEESKGDSVHIEAHRLMKEARDEGNLNFIGNIEARDVTEGGADVIVSDGFSGNVLLKSMEGMALYMSGMIKKMFMKNLLTKVAALILKNGIKELRGSIDYKEIGGAPLIGTDKPIIKAHGSANAYAFKNAVRQAAEYSQSGFIQMLAEEIR